MRHAQILPLSLAAALGAFLFPVSGYSLGTRIADQDAEATARGDAFAATADNPSAIYYNPAGITQMDGFTAMIGGYGIYIHEHYDPLPGSGGHQSTNHQEPQAAPQFFATYHPADKPFAFGLGVYAPFGFKLEYPDDASFRAAGLYGSLQFIDVNPVLAVQVTRSLSVAVGISVDYASAELRQGLTSAQGDLFAFKGSGVAVGANAGILWKPTERQSIGFSYHSPVSASLTGHTDMRLSGAEIKASEKGNQLIAAGRASLAAGIAKINKLASLGYITPAQKQALTAQANAQFQSQLAAAGVPASGMFPTSFPTVKSKGTLPFPQYAVLGYSFRPAPDWNLEADIDWTDWDSLNTVTLHQSDHTTVKIPFNWTHSFFYELGATHYMGPWRASAGYIYSESSVPSGSFNPVIPDSARHIFSCGVGRTFGACSVDLAYQLSIGDKRTIVNDSVADGRYSFVSHAVELSLGYHF